MYYSEWFEEDEICQQALIKAHPRRLFHVSLFDWIVLEELRRLLRSSYENATPNLCWVSCAINKGGFFGDCIRRRSRHTFASLWGACLRVASLWRTNSRGDSCFPGVHHSSVCRGLLFCVRKAYIFQEFDEGPLPTCVGWIFQNVHLWKVSAAVAPQSKNLARRPLCHKVNLQSCVARRPLCHKVNLPRCEARRRRFIMTCDIFGTGQTNILGLCYLFGKTYKQPTVAPLKSLKSTHSTKLLHLLRRTIRYH